MDARFAPTWTLPKLFCKLQITHIQRRCCEVLVLLQWLWLLLVPHSGRFNRPTCAACADSPAAKVQCFCRGRLFINFVPGIIWPGRPRRGLVRDFNVRCVEGHAFFVRCSMLRSSSLDKAFTVFMVFHVCCQPCCVRLNWRKVVIRLDQTPSQVLVRHIVLESLAGSAFQELGICLLVSAPGPAQPRPSARRSLSCTLVASLDIRPLDVRVLQS